MTLVCLSGIASAVGQDWPAEPRQTQVSSRIDVIDLTEDELILFVTKVDDFLYRFGQPLDDEDYSVLNHLSDSAGQWNDQAYGRYKYEAIKLCERAGSYDALGLAEEVGRIGDEYYERYSERVRSELAKVSENTRHRIKYFMEKWGEAPPQRPWDLLVSVIHRMHSPKNVDEFWCKVAHERL